MLGGSAGASGARTRFALLALSSTALGWPGGARAEATAELAISVVEPAGFEALAAEQTLLVDVYFGGRRIGEAEIETSRGDVSFADPQALVAMIPGLEDSARLLPSIAAGTLPANGRLACAQGADRSACGRLEPGELGVILDRDNLRLDLFVNPRLLAVAAPVAETYLPPPAAGLSLINAVGAVISGTTEGRDGTLYDVSDRLLVGLGQSRLIAEFGHSSDLGFRSEQVVFEQDLPEKRLLAGAFSVANSELIGRQKLLGIGIESQIDTRADREDILGAPVVVFLSQRSKVDILRDGRILASRAYEAGNQKLDTSALPEGAYEITLRIAEARGGQREETRFFSKSRRVPSFGRQDFFAFAGLRIDDPLSLRPSDTPLVQAGVARRLTRHLALDAMATLSGGEAGMQAGGTFMTPVVTVRAAVLGTSDGSRGGLLQLSSSGYSRLNFSAELRRLDLAGDGGRISAFAPARFDLAEVSESPASKPADSFWQAAATVSYGTGGLQLFGSAFYRRNDGEAESYGVGPSVRWEFLQSDALRLAVDGNAVATRRGTTGYVGISLSLVGRSRSLSASAGPRLSSVRGEADGLAGTLTGALQASDFIGGELNLAAGYERQPGLHAVNASGQLRGEALSLAADVIRSDDRDRSQTRYSASAQTVLAVGPGAAALQGRGSSDSLVVARVKGARASDRFEVLVNDTAAGALSGGESLALSLPSYRAYDVRLRAVGGELVSYDGSTRRIGLYPGNVRVLEWDARPIRVIIGRLLFEDGSPVAGARLKAPGGLAETDPQGNFQIESAGDGYLDVTLASGLDYRVAVPDQEAAEWAMVGDLRCCSVSRAGAFAANQLGN